MNTQKKVTVANDNMNNNAHYDVNGKITRTDDRDRRSPDIDWNAEGNRTGRNK
ncbi:hypothetical protein ACLI1A_17195 [Flavobacterium sp. RHBU_3]|uniref:hypothetical protein n=1 Tax=Flavobacterium sp. RHBU_3 TaxID=3391184 RepID=UPI003984E3F2